MNRLKKAEKFGQVLGLALGALLSRVLNEKLITKDLPVSLITFALVAVIVTCAKLCENLVSELLDRSWLLRKIVASHAFIEGTWFDYMEGEGSYSLISIRYVDSELTLHGDAYTLLGDPISIWDALMEEFDGTTLEYLYNVSLIKTGHVYSGKLGYSKLVFSRDSVRRAPNRFTGSFADLGETQALFHTRGIRLTANEEKRIRIDPTYASQLLERLGARVQPSVSAGDAHV